MKECQPLKQKVLYEELTPGEFRERMADASIMTNGTILCPIMPQCWKPR
jgi:hypothetical protein